jgi:hypothetical protein
MLTSPSPRPAEVDARVRARELGELLAAPAAGRAGLAALGQDGLDDLPVARGDHRADGGRLGALADGVRRVLHVASSVEPTARGPDARADPKSAYGAWAFARARRANSSIGSRASLTVPSSGLGFRQTGRPSSRAA